MAMVRMEGGWGVVGSNGECFHVHRGFYFIYYFFFVRLNVSNRARGYARAVPPAVLVLSVALLQSYVIDSAIVSDDACTFT